MNKKCPICLGYDINEEDTTLSVFKCNECSHEFSLIGENEKEKYENEYYDVRSKNWFNNPNYKLFNWIYQQIPKDRRIKLLDIGCGNGAFLKYIRHEDKNIQLFGIDLIKNNHQNINFIQGNIYKEKIDQKFDVIASLGTIEHLNELHLFISIIKKLLEKGGIAIIMTIDSDSLVYKISKILKKYRLRTAYNRLYEYKHLNHFTRKSLRKLIEKEDFLVLQHITHNYPLKAVDVPDAGGVY